MLSGHLVTQAISVATRLQIPDALARGPRGVAALARARGVRAHPPYRMLRALGDAGGFVELPRAPSVLSFCHGEVDSIDLTTEHIGTRFLACVVEIGQHAA